MAASDLYFRHEKGFVPLPQQQAFGVAKALEKEGGRRSQWRVIAVNDYCRLPDAIRSRVQNTECVADS